ncbi:MAG: bifunctional serine/threonine-protein kinase/formylglycine-generating enzyme family protein [Chloroflexota bacterium]
MPLSIGQVLHNRYRVVKLLGQGGFGAVYRAWDTNLERPCAIKENLDASPEAGRQFKREAGLLVELAHPNLPRVFDSFTLPGQGQYLVMDFVEGQDLQELLDKAGAPLPEAQVLEWALQICDALAYLHRQSPPIIHRDLKPANLRITPGGKACLVDFGLAKLYDPAKRTTLGARAVTPGYAPFEQYGQRPTDARTDVYALGATLYHALTGATPPESIDRVGGAALLPPRQLNPGVTPAVEAVMLRALEMMPDARYQSAAELRQALVQAQAQGGAVQSVRTGSVPPTQVVSEASPPRPAAARPVKPPAAVGGSSVTRGLALGGGTLALLVLGLAGIVGLIWWVTSQSPKATQAPRPAKTLVGTPSIDVPMVLIPAGEFQMGGDADVALAECKKLYYKPEDCSRNWFTNEEPIHTVYLDGYSIDAYEVTNARYAECVAAGTCDPPTASESYTRSSYYGSSQYADYPVVYVSWEMANAYCEWRGGRLPTEAEWEKAARGGLEGKLYPWGDDFDGRRVNFCDKNCGFEWANQSYDDGYNDTAPVGSYAPNGYGLYDMAGNAWEWVQDWYLESFYGSSPRDNPSGPASGEYRVLRGGSWYYDEWVLRAAYRLWRAPAGSFNIVGFRCVRLP